MINSITADPLISEIDTLIGTPQEPDGVLFRLQALAILRDKSSIENQLNTPEYTNFISNLKKLYQDFEALQSGTHEGQDLGKIILNIFGNQEGTLGHLLSGTSDPTVDELATTIAAINQVHKTAILDTMLMQFEGRYN